MIRSIAVAYMLLAVGVIVSGQSPGAICVALAGTGITFVVAGLLWRVEKRAPGRPSTRDLHSAADLSGTGFEEDTHG